MAEMGQIPLVICRHGRTRFNAEKRFLGRLDVPLDPHGEREAELLGARLRGMPRAGLWASPLARAWQTALRIGAPKPQICLQELDQGALEGNRAPEMLSRYPEFFAAWAEDPAHARVPGGETLAECRDRAVEAVIRLARAHEPGPPLVIVSHQMVMAALVLTALGLPLKEFRKHTQGNVAISLFGWSEATGLVLHRFNDTAHTDGLLPL